MMTGAQSTQSSRPEGVLVLLLVQSIFWMVAGLSAFPFAFAGEFHMIGLGLASLLLALFTCLMGIGVLWRRRWARRTALIMEIVCLVGAAVVLVLPIGANRGPVAILVNLVLPAAVIALLWGKKTRSDFS